MKGEAHMEKTEVKAFRDGNKITVILKNPSQEQLEMVSRLVQDGIDEVTGYKQVSASEPATPVDPVPSNPVPAKSEDESHLQGAIQFAWNGERLRQMDPSKTRDLLYRYLSTENKKAAQAFWAELKKENPDKNFPTTKKAIIMSARKVLELFRAQYPMAN